MKVEQPDFTSCGAYATAFLLSLIDGQDPSKVQYAHRDLLRKHFAYILRTRTLSLFPIA